VKSNLDRSSIRIPVKLVDGQWEYFYGGGLYIRNGSVGDLVIHTGAIENDGFLEHLKRKLEYKILDVGTELLVALTIKEKPSISDKLRQYLIPAHTIQFGITDNQTSVAHNSKFVRVIICEPTARQQNMGQNKTGGVWLQLEGAQPKSISTSGVIVPNEVSVEPLESLNHAFTRLSETFEPWRKAHTGSIYERVLYKEKNDRWYPLNVLRDEAIATDEHELAKQMWEDISSQLNLNLR
jgi:hypothetical protein